MGNCSMTTLAWDRHAWKGCVWADLDALELPPGTRVELRHNAGNIMCATLREDGPRLGAVLGALVVAGRAVANPKITGFVKVVEHTRVDGVPLAQVLLEWI